ncbi:hypothetical protein WJX73_009088 [Symbiochloris irregularis]|uniref:Ribosomal RNA processing 1 n=1 Tax=Symbiochloris irregularis TaxID=706552 RepID=A0AAW1NXW2_9CHLO
MGRARPERRSLVADRGVPLHHPRALGSTDFHTRQTAVRDLAAWLSSSKQCSREDLLQLWKGLFYAFWHSDQADVQAELAHQLAGLPSAAPLQVKMLYYECFVVTMQREWFGIDKHRLDKFLLLVRRFLIHLFQQASEDRGQSEGWKAVLLQLLVNKNDPAASGLSYHAADILFESAKEAAAEEPIPKAALTLLLNTSCETILQTNKQLLVGRLRRGVFDAIAEHLDDEPAPDAALLHLDASELSADLLALGAQPGVVSKSRKALYELSHAFQAVAASQHGGTGHAEDMKLDQQAGSLSDKHCSSSAADHDMDVHPAGAATSTDLQTLSSEVNGSSLKRRDDSGTPQLVGGHSLRPVPKKVHFAPKRNLRQPEGPGYGSPVPASKQQQHEPPQQQMTQRARVATSGQKPGRRSQGSRLRRVSV